MLECCDGDEDYEGSVGELPGSEMNLIDQNLHGRGEGGGKKYLKTFPRS